MTLMSLQVLQQRIVESELGKEWLKDPLLSKDIWTIKELGYSEEEEKICETKKIYFRDFRIPWLKLLTKLTVKAKVRQKGSIGTIIRQVHYLKKLDKFLLGKGCNDPELITDDLLGEFISQGEQQNRQSVITVVVKLWEDEQWLKLKYTPKKLKKPTPKIEIIPEEVLCQIYEKFYIFPPPLERLFRLQFVLGARLGEILRMPRQCLNQEGNHWYLQKWVEKIKKWKFYQVHPSVAQLVREQQKFLDTHLDSELNFDKLFCKVSVGNQDGAKGSGNRFDREVIYLPEMMSASTIRNWLRDFSERADLRDKQGNRFKLQSHQFRRTKASIMAYCEAEDEYIAAVLGHGSLEMLPYYRQRSLERLEKEANTKGYVNKYGQITTFKPRKRRYEKLAELLKVSTPLGECHRPTMLGDCQSRYACLSCEHHRVTLEDKEQLEADYQELKQNLKQAKTAMQERRVTEINRLLELQEVRLQGLKKIEEIKEHNVND